MKLGDLPAPGSVRWFEWRKSCLTIETWLAQEAARPPAPALHEPLPAPTAPPPPRTQPRASSAAPPRVDLDGLEAAVDRVERRQDCIPDEDPWARINAMPMYGESAAINPWDDPNDPTRSHPSGGPLSVRMPPELGDENRAHDKPLRGKSRVRKDTDEPRDNSWWSKD
jgi:hypothetical protein